MLKKIDGSTYLRFLENGVKNVEKNKKTLNDLNVFPVPDGDTGTNMLMTLRCGLNAVIAEESNLSTTAKSFAKSAVLGARGNSGVIISQFFKGIANSFSGMESADCAQFLNALESGYTCAYSAVVKPVEGTMLTVLRQACEECKKIAPFESFESLIENYLNFAKRSLAKTPELLSVLKKAGVVDSGGSGVVCFFEGVDKFLKGETIETEEETEVLESVDLSRFNKDTRFIYGYCVEGVLQLRVDGSEFNKEDLKEDLTRLGGSIVMTLEGDKLKLHIHTKTPGNVINACQNHGEFLTVKIENMTVQNVAKADKEEREETKKFLFSEEKSHFSFAVVAVAPNKYLQKSFFDMGADVVILSDIAPSAQDFLKAFDYARSKEILVFSNSSNSILTCVHAASLYKKGRITVLNSRSVHECYLAIGLIDFEDGVDKAIETLNESIANICRVTVYHADKEIIYGKQKVAVNEFFALEGKNILQTGSTVEEVVLKTVEGVVNNRECNLLTLFYGADVAEEFIQAVADKIRENHAGLEINIVETRETACDITLAFE